MTMTTATHHAYGTVPTREELVDRAAALVPLLRKHAAETEERRSLSEASLAAITEAGLARLCVPVEYGGYGHGIATLTAVAAELGRGCASSAWVVGVSGQIAVSPKSPAINSALYGAGPDAWLCGSLNPTAGEVEPVDGGVRLTGRWGYASGCAHSRWAMVLATGTAPDGGRSVHGLTVPMSDLTIDEDWWVAGMGGSGSHTIVASDVFVPADRVMTPTGERTAQQTILSGIGGSVMMAGPLLGAAHGALDLVHETLAAKKKVVYSRYPSAPEAVVTQLWLAEATQHLDTARLHTRRAADAIDAAVASGTAMSLVERARARMDVTTAVEACRQAMARLLDIHGASGFAQANPLQRAWRDLETASRHGFLNTQLAREAYGRALIGIDEPIATNI
ncbi:acyl-CoA dehydrogenase family protein [Streptomyces sp. NPDC039022]|uniref:acyl-CoA dehydrogenase family protein n=1 Tax=Streptomyces sp. NPDC039022 TaxID=3157091 RepID=UPI0033F553F6